MAIQKIIWCIFMCVVLVTQIFALEIEDCVKNGLYEHPTECDKFYSCTPSGPVLMQCPAGLHFDPEYLVCDWPQNAACNGNIVEDTENDPHLSCPIYPHPEDCTKFYLCSPSGPTLIECPESLHFNAQLLVCDWSQNVKCFDTSKRPNMTMIAENQEIFSDNDSTLEIGTTTSTIDESPQTDNKIQEEPTAMTTSDNEEGSGSRPQDYITNEMSNISTAFIPADSNSTSLCKSNIWPHPNECNKFFICGATGAIELVCPEELLFNPVLLFCDWPYNARCDPTLEITTTSHIKQTPTLMDDLSGLTLNGLQEQTELTPVTEENGTTEVTGTTSESLYTSTSIESDTIFPNFESTEICQGSIWPNLNDCTKFFKCGATGAVEMSCPEELHFNPVLLVCDWPYIAGCYENRTELTTDATTTEYFSESTTVTEYVEITATEDLDKTTTENTYLLDENVTENLGEEGTGITDEPTTIRANSTQECKDIIWPNSNDCVKFFIGGANGAVEVSCPEDLHFNPVRLICDYPYQAGCKNYFDEMNTTDTTTDYETEFSGISTEISDATTDITNDFLAVKTTENAIESTPNIEYLGTTVLEDVQSTTDNSLLTSSPEVQTETTTFSTLTSEINIIKEADNIDTQGIEATLVSSSESTVEFQNTELCKSPIWPHPNDCRKFFMCGSTGAVEMSCSEELYFNPALLVCDWPRNGECTS